MAILTWDQTGQRLYETGVEKGVLYIPDAQGVYTNGVAWNGLTAVTESPSGAEATALYADNIKYLNLYSAEEFGATIEAYTYPTEFAQFDGVVTPPSATGLQLGQQGRKPFGLSYQTKVGNDLLGNDFGYKIHLIYGATASPSEKAFSTINDSPEAITFSWELMTIPVAVTGFKPTSIVVVDSTKASVADLAALNDMLYGTAGTSPRLPFPDELITLFNSAQTVVTVTAPTATTAGVITIPTVTGVTYFRADTGVTVTGTVNIVGVGNSLTIRARPTNGTYVFSAASDDDFVFTKTV